MSDAAVAVGASAIPGPITDRADDGWFLYVPIVQTNFAATAVGRNFNQNTNYDFDSKAKRRVQSGEQVVFMVENLDAADAFDVMLILRMLSMITGT